MNKNNKILLILVATVLSIIPLKAQEETDLSTRYRAIFDYKIDDGLHAKFSEELRLNQNFGFESNFMDVSLSYKISEWLRTECGYVFIAKQDISKTGEKEMDLRHRLRIDINGTYKVGSFKLSLRERFQGTYFTKSINEYQKSKVPIILRTRLKASYKFYTIPFEPYAAVEYSTLMNGAKWDNHWMDTDKYMTSKFEGHNHVYLNKTRYVAGVEWQLDARSSVDFYAFYDKKTDWEIDSNKEGTALKLPVTIEKTNSLIIGFSYNYSF